ncbi:MAG: flagellar biosynthetic protein FliR [Aquificota bacterium]|nr:flagellar biosynthetic protein FliR [Aquificota bacterium]
MIVLDVHTVLTVSLIALRVFSFVVLVPAFGTFFIPGSVRVFLSLGLAFSLMFLVKVDPVNTTSLPEILAMALQEVLFGFTAGFLLRLLFDAVLVAGEIIAVHTGLGFLTMFLPQQPQATVMAGFSTLLASTLFLTLGGAETVFLGLAESLKRVPPGSFDLYSLDGEVFLKFFYESFSMGVKIALPVLIAALLTNVILAVVNRFIPQINVFMVGLPLQIAVGLVVFALSLPVMGFVLASYMRDHILDFLRFVSLSG